MRLEVDFAVQGADVNGLVNAALARLESLAGRPLQDQERAKVHLDIHPFALNGVGGVHSWQADVTAVLVWERG